MSLHLILAIVFSHVIVGSSAEATVTLNACNRNDPQNCAVCLECDNGASILPESCKLMSGNQDLSKLKPTLFLLSLLPYPDVRPKFQPSWDEGPTLILAEQLAVEQANKRQDILQGYNVELIKADSGCDISSKALIAFVSNVLHSERNISGIVGPGCSTSATTVSPLNGQDSLGLINVHIAGSHLLTDRAAYPNSFGTLDSTGVFVKAAISLMERNGWTQVATLYDESRVYYYSTLQAFEEEIRNQGGYELSFSSAVYNTYIPFGALRESYARIIFLFVGPDLLSRIICLAYHQRFIFPSFQWIIVSRTAEEITATSFNYQGTHYSCNDEEILLATNGSLIIHYKLKALNSSHVTDSGLTYGQFQDLYHEKVEAFNQHCAGNNTIAPSFWDASYFDAVWSLVLALNRTAGETGVILSDYRYGQNAMTEAIKNQLLELDFEGVSGRIKFDNETGYVKRAVDVYQINRGSMELVAYYSAGEIIEVANSNFINSRFDKRFIKVPIFLTVLFILVTLGGVALTVTTHIATFMLRKHRSVKASSPNLTQIAFIGCYVVPISILSYITAESFDLPPKDHCNIYHLINSALYIGLTLVLATVCVKTWRLYRIFVHFRNPGRLISDQVLLLLITVCLLVAVVLCTVWIVVDPFVPRQREVFVSSSLPPLVFIELTCAEKHFFLWYGLSTGFVGFLMICALWLSVASRRIPQKDFKTKSIILLVYSLSVVIGLGAPVYFVLSYSRQLGIIPEFIVLCILLNVPVYLCIAFLFLPPIMPLIVAKWRRFSKPLH